MRKWYQKDDGKTILYGEIDDIELHHSEATEIPDKPGEDYIWIKGKWISDPKAYISHRQQAYPSIGDQLDAIWKHLNYRRFLGDELIQEADDLLGQILQVKEDYPKQV